MKFDLKTPCPDCPFVKGSSTNRTLDPERIQGIVHDIKHDATFTCHKTLEQPVEVQQHCAGALIFLENGEHPNNMLRIAERLGLYDYTKLNRNADIIDDPSPLPNRKDTIK